MSELYIHPMRCRVNQIVPRAVAAQETGGHSAAVENAAYEEKYVSLSLFGLIAGSSDGVPAGTWPERYCTWVVIGLLLSTISMAKPRTAVLPGLLA